MAQKKASKIRHHSWKAPYGDDDYDCESDNILTIIAIVGICNTLAPISCSGLRKNNVEKTYFIFCWHAILYINPSEQNICAYNFPQINQRTSTVSFSFCCCCGYLLFKPYAFVNNLQTEMKQWEFVRFWNQLHICTLHICWSVVILNPNLTEKEGKFK